MKIKLQTKSKQGVIFLPILVGALALILIVAVLFFIIAVKGPFLANTLNKTISGTNTAYAYDGTGYFGSGYLADSNAATAEDLNKILAGTAMAGFGPAIKKAADKYHLNPVYITAHAALESAWGGSKIAQDKKNYFGFQAYDSCPYECAKTYSSFDECVDDVMGYVKTQYLTPGGAYYEGETLEAMNQHYATSPAWADGIKNIMIEIYQKIGKTPPAFSGGTSVT